MVQKTRARTALGKIALCEDSLFKILPLLPSFPYLLLCGQFHGEYARKCRWNNTCNTHMYSNVIPSICKFGALLISFWIFRGAICISQLLLFFWMMRIKKYLLCSEYLAFLIWTVKINGGNNDNEGIFYEFLFC